jgi:hypothetical protein
MRPSTYLIALLTGCSAAQQDRQADRVDRPDAVVAADRSGHWLDRPWPSDEDRRADGTLPWDLLPAAPTDLGTTVVSGWAAQAAATAQGASHQPAIFFRFEETFELTAGDLGLAAADGAQVPLTWHWVEQALGDPWLADNLLVVMPEPTAPLASGERYVAWVSTSVADPAPGWVPPEGSPNDAAVATAFTVQDSLGQLRSLMDAVDSTLDTHPEYLQADNFREVVALRYAQGETPSGIAATVATATYADGGTDDTYLAPKEGAEPFTLTLDESWPMAVFETHITTVAFQGLAGQPWASAGLGLLTDFDRLDDGWMRFAEGQLTSTPEAETMRVVVQVPRSGAGPFPVLTWDHGTGGHAYNAVGRSLVDDDHLGVAQALSSAVVVSRDQPLYGQRFGLIDAGFGSSLGFYNIGNLPCFRDNQRQAAADHRVLHRFVREALPSFADVDLSRIGAFGHSLGSVTAHAGLVGQGLDGAAAGLMSGSGGYLTYYVLDTGLLDQEYALVDVLAPLLGLEEEEIAEAGPSDLVGALIGLPPEAWPQVGRHHPAMQLFQVVMDPSDPLMWVGQQQVRETIVMGIDDHQVPNDTTRWLAEVHPDAELVECVPSGEYDGHWCTFREPLALATISDFLEGL